MLSLQGTGHIARACRVKQRAKSPSTRKSVSAYKAKTVDEDEFGDKEEEEDTYYIKKMTIRIR